MTQFSVPWTSRKPRFGPFGRLLAAIGKGIYAVATPILPRVALLIFLATLVVTPLLVWACGELFAFTLVAVGEASPAGQPDVEWGAPSTWGLPPAAIGSVLTTRATPAAGLMKYVVWICQFRIVRDLVILGAIFALFCIVPAFAIWWERKVAGRIQSRLGLMRVGGWHGWAQSAADGLKLVLKEDLVPAGADQALFRAAPYFTIIPSLCAFVALPFGLLWVFRELDSALLFILAMLGVEVVGVIVGGWASNNKWSLYGAMREACQMVSYEIPLGMALLVPVICAGTLSLVEIGKQQTGGWFSWLAFTNPFAFAAFVTYFIASLAACKRAPFDLPEAESELVAGFMTEYSGFRWALFFFAEYAAMFVVAALACILFLGGWNSPLPAAWGDSITTVLGSAALARGLKGVLFSGPLWLLFKCGVLLYTQLWVRWTLPRIRIDQVLYACVQVLLPLTMLLVLGTAVWVWVSMSGSAGWEWFARIVNWILGLIGLVFAAGFVVIAVYGFIHRRPLVGYLAMDPLSGA
ncbi:MAG TPA: NADH-quinone oxidoreductase subunit NuoH [Phycisphaerae bacterium]|nr:NADH-quinone oxidoreductase subunit NuoH [Phycisphaerae bacterium]HNU46611.1 NADH-quinone oxidoreductase subunit NuoH [Phycisphaerae bacterium]